jgi:Fe-S-cluster containining protein
MLIFFCRLKKSIQEETAKYCSAGFAYKCLALSRTNRCLIYHFRPKLCRIYDCNGAEQIAHSLLNLPRLNLLPENENSSEDLMKKAIKEEELCTKTSS